MGVQDVTPVKLLKFQMQKLNSKVESAEWMTPSSENYYCCLEMKYSGTVFEEYHTYKAECGHRQSTAGGRGREGDKVPDNIMTCMQNLLLVA